MGVRSSLEKIKHFFSTEEMNDWLSWLTKIDEMCQSCSTCSDLRKKLHLVRSSKADSDEVRRNKANKRNKLQQELNAHVAASAGSHLVSLDSDVWPFFQSQSSDAVFVRPSESPPQRSSAEENLAVVLTDDRPPLMQVGSSRRRMLPGLEVGMYVFIRLTDHVNPWGVGRLLSYEPSREEECYCIAWHGNQSDKLKGRHYPAWKDAKGRTCFKDTRMHPTWEPWSQWVSKRNIIFWGVFKKIFNNGKSSKWQVKSNIVRQVQARLADTPIVSTP